MPKVVAHSIWSEQSRKTEETADARERRLRADFAWTIIRRRPVIGDLRQLIRAVMSIPANASVQRIAKRVLSEITTTITAESSERTIASTANALLSRYGVAETWYYDCPALVLLGSRSCLSISGHDYQPSDEVVGQTNLVTIDVSPLVGKWWGDCARSFVVERGRVTSNPSLPEFQDGTTTVRELHASMCRFATPTTRFCDLYRFANDWITVTGFENIDFLNNVGHSIAARLDDRLFINEDTTELLGSVECFTFEPHIRQNGGRWGFKHEDIYYFDETGQPTIL